MTVELTYEQIKLIDQQLATGKFANKSEVIGEALALLKRQAEGIQEMLEAFREAHERNVNLDVQAELDSVEEVLKEHRQHYR